PGAAVFRLRVNPDDIHPLRQTIPERHILQRDLAVVAQLEGVIDLLACLNNRSFIRGYPQLEGWFAAVDHPYQLIARFTLAVIVFRRPGDSSLSHRITIAGRSIVADPCFRVAG